MKENKLIVLALIFYSVSFLAVVSFVVIRRLTYVPTENIQRPIEICPTTTCSNLITTKADQNIKNFPSFFIREDKNYILYTDRGNGKERMGLSIPVQQEQYYDLGQKKTLYRDQPLTATISLDGKKVVYLAKEDSKAVNSYNLYVANADGTDKTMLAEPEWGYAHGDIVNHFFWDFDSQNVVYADRKIDEVRTEYDVYKINVLSKVKVAIVSDSVSWNPGDYNTQTKEVEIVPAGFYHQ